MNKRDLFPLLLVTAMLLTGPGAWAQKPYVWFNAGYGASMSSQNMYSPFDDVYLINQTISAGSKFQEQVNISLGKGLNAGGAFGLKFNKYVGAELAVNYLIGGKSKAKYIFSEGTTDFSIYARMLRIIPSFVVSADLDYFNPYAKFGVVISTGSIYSEANGNYGPPNEPYTEKCKYSGGMGFGISAGLGATMKMSKHTFIFCELNTVNMSYAPKKGEITDFTRSGTDQLGTMTVKEKQIDFVDKFTVYNTTPDNSPQQMLRMKMPLGSIGLNFGIKLDL